MLSHTRHPMLLLAMALLWLPMPTANAQPSNTAGPSFLFLSDIHLKTDATATAYGSDTGMDLWAIFLRKADSVLAGTDAPRFIVYTGDLPAHYNPCCYLPPDQRGIHNQNIDTILTGLRRLADKYNKPLFYMPGNNDGLAGDYTSFADEKLQTPFSLVYDKANPYPALNILPGKAKAPCMVSNPHPRMGYYAARPIEGLRLICLNSVIFSGKFEPVDNSNPFNDANAQLAWLAQQLAEAQKAREKVYLAMHIPPGNDAYNTGQPMWANSYNGVPTRWLHRFLNLVAQYQSTISGILYGHTHMDEVRRLYAPQSNKVTAVAISCPGVTPLYNNNPGFKTVRYHPVSKQLLDFTTYYTTPGATSWGNASYTFSDAYPGNGATIYQRLTQPQWSAATIAAYMANIYKVGNGTAQVYVIQNGIDVRANGNQGWNR